MADNTIILGCGIIGLSTAYYLSTSISPSTIHLIDPSPTLFSSASGYAAGFLAADWFSPSVSALGRLSFEEHRRLAAEAGGGKRWGYVRSRGVGYTVRRGGGKKKGRGTEQEQEQEQEQRRGDEWLRDGGSRANVIEMTRAGDLDANRHAPAWLKRRAGDDVERISEEGSTAQVDPLRLCRFLLDTCLSRGVHLHHPARAQSIEQDLRDEISSIRVLNTATGSVTSLPCAKVLITSGAWTPAVFESLFRDSKVRIPIGSLAGHSLVVRTPGWREGAHGGEERGQGQRQGQGQGEGEEDREGEGAREEEEEDEECHAIFTTDDEAGYSPEVFSRSGGEIYIAGLNDASLNLPELATDAKAQINPQSIEILRNTAKRLLLDADMDNADEEVIGVGEELEIVREGLCFRPVNSRKGTPILGRVEDGDLGGGMKTRGGGDGGVWIAAGHGPWGISLSLGTGKVMAEMIRGVETSVDVRGLGL